MATAFYERHNPRHRALSKRHVPAIPEGVQECGDSCLGLDAMDRPVHLHIDSAEYADKTPNRVYRTFGIDNPSYKAK